MKALAADSTRFESRVRRWRLFAAALAFGGALFASPSVWAQAEGEPVEDNAASDAQGTQASEAKKPEIELPKLQRFAPAVYPKQAEQEGLEAEVVLELVIDASGKVTAARSVKPVGHGFDQAAEQAAMKLEFTPATRDGQPIAAKILFRYQFELTPEVVPPEKAAPRSTGNLSGRLLIAGGEVPLVGAEVLVVSESGTEYRVVTDAEGRWSLSELPPGSYHVRLNAAGFGPIDLEEQVVAGEETGVTYRVLPKTEGLQVTVEGERPPREVTRRTLERRELQRIPGTSGDALRALQSLPGVARPPGLAGLLIVRGSSPQSTETFVNGSNIPLIYHFGGLSSVVPTELLDRIDFYPGNFSARYGRLMGGVVDVGLRSPNTRCYGDYGKPTEETGCYHGMAQIDLIDGRILVQGPVGPLKDWSFALAGRRSWVDTWLKPVLEEAGSSVTSAPVYYDYQAIIDHTPSQDEKLSLRFFGSDDRFEIIVNDPVAQDPAFGGNLSFGTGFYRAQALYEAKLSSNVEVNSMFSVGKDSLDFSVGTFLFDLVSYPAVLRNEFGFSLGERAKLNVGMDFLVAPFEATVRAPPPPRPGEPDPGPFAARPPLLTTTKGTVFRPAWYAEAEVQPTERLRVIPGVRVDYARDSSHADLSPRIVARYDLVRSGEAEENDPLKRRMTLKGGAGLFYQPPQFQETDEVFGTPNLESNRSVHYSLGVEKEFTQQIELSVEGFYKDMDQLVARSPSSAGGFAYNNQGQGHVIGLETLLKYKPGERFFGWVAYTLSRSVRKDAPTEAERLFQYDQTHNLIVLGSYRLGRGWEFGARFRLISGPLATPVLRPPALPALYAADAGSYVPLQGEPYSQRLSPFHQLDLRVDKHWQFKHFRLSTYVDVQNVYNHQTVEALVYNYNFSQQRAQTGLPIIPSIGVRGEF